MDKKRHHPPGPGAHKFASSWRCGVDHDLRHRGRCRSRTASRYVWAYPYRPSTREARCRRCGRPRTRGSPRPEFETSHLCCAGVKSLHSSCIRTLLPLHCFSDVSPLGIRHEGSASFLLTKRFTVERPKKKRWRRGARPFHARSIFLCYLQQRNDSNTQPTVCGIS